MFSIGFKATFRIPFLPYYSDIILVTPIESLSNGFLVYQLLTFLHSTTVVVILLGYNIIPYFASALQSLIVLHF